MNFTTEQSVQDWLESLVATGNIKEAIDGSETIDEALKHSESVHYWPEFPIDYLTRLHNLHSARSVLNSLSNLELVSKNSANLSRTKRESLFTDLLYCAVETAQFVIFEIKNQKASVREAVTELLAYEHEIFNHMPFGSSNDVSMVFVSRDFPTLLDHAITGLNVWSRRRILCLRFDDSSSEPRLIVHIPAVWAPIGQNTLPASGIVTANLYPYPESNLSIEQAYRVCETAAALMVRNAERAGGSGFAIVARDHFYPALTQSPFVIIAGVVNPFCFLPEAESRGFVTNSSSLSKYLLDDAQREGLSSSWNWLASDGNSAFEYLEGFGSPAWEGLSDWSQFRDVRRWRHHAVTSDRHLTPVSMDFWGFLGDYARDIVKQTARLKKFMPTFANPGTDWRKPRLGVFLLDNIAVIPVLDEGQWTFSALFSFGVRLGRFLTFMANFVSSDDEAKGKLRAGLFWAEADMSHLLMEVSVRYLAATELQEPPPPLQFNQASNEDDIERRGMDFANWILSKFIGSNNSILQQAFDTGLTSYALYDGVFVLPDSELAAVRSKAVAAARNWLKWTVIASTSALFSAEVQREVTAAVDSSFGDNLPLDRGKDDGLASVDNLDEEELIDKLFDEIPAIVSLWHPQLTHTLVPITKANIDWDWYEEQIRERRSRGVKYPCIVLDPNGQMGIGELPSDSTGLPIISNPDEEVLFVQNESSARFVLRKRWADIKAKNASDSYNSLDGGRVN